MICLYCYFCFMNRDYDILLQKLNDFIKEYYKNLMVRGVVYSMIGLASMFITISLAEHFSFFDTWVRTSLFWVYCTISFLVLIRFICIPVIKMLRLSDTITHEQAAQIIGEHFYEISDKLINILELKKIKEGNQSLIEASIGQKIKDIQFAQFKRAVDWKKTFYYARFLIIPSLILALFFLSGNQDILSNSTFRIINYNQEFLRPAPFMFQLKQDSLIAVENEDVSIEVEITGKEIPTEVYVHINGMRAKMNKISNTTHEYTFSQIQKNTQFYLSANEEFSKEHEIIVLQKPTMERLSITVQPPKNTGIKTEKLINIGSLTVPEGSLLTWNIDTKNADTLLFQINKKDHVVEPTNNSFTLKQRIYSDTKYSLSFANDKLSFVDTTYYNINIIADSHPIISINQIDTNTIDRIITGVIQDDYGFYDLKFVTKVHGLFRDTLWEEFISINPALESQTFIQSLMNIDQVAKAGETIESYFIVRDNDSKNGYKATSSEVIIINLPSYDDVRKEYTEENETSKNTISAELSILETIKKELIEFEKSLIEKDSLDWRDRKKLEDILTEQTKLEKKIENLKEDIKSNFEQINSISEPTEEILKKQEELEKLFNDIMSDEVKDLYRELNELKDKLNKSDLQEKLKEMQLSNEDVSKELDRNLEILKQVEFDQQLEDIINQLKELSEQQQELSKNSENSDKTTINQQQQIIEFEKIKKEIDRLNILNNALENQHTIQDTQQQEDQITEELQHGMNQLEKNRKKQASKAQKSASDQLKSLANLFASMQKENDTEQNYEDMGVLREILENLVYFSIQQEDLLLTFSEVDKNDPLYVSLMHKQQSLRDASQIIEDSLFALSKRVPQISSKVNREINAIDKKSESSINHLRERLTPKAVQDQQFVMTAANNLAVMLSHVLESMQQDMASDLPSTQQCEKPGKGSPKPGDLKKMQEELNAHLKKMQEKLKKGEQNNMENDGTAKSLMQMLAKQELIRQELEKLRKEIDAGKGQEALEDAIKKMEETEEDIANKKITLESLSRQKQIVTRLLEVENSMRQQGEDNERESKTAINNYERIVQDAYHKYELEKLNQNEMLKTTPLHLNRYYKEKVNRYFNLIIQKPKK